MSSERRIRDALLYLGYGQLRDGLVEDALETFSAAHLMDASDDLALRARDLAMSEMNATLPRP